MDVAKRLVRLPEGGTLVRDHAGVTMTEGESRGLAANDGARARGPREYAAAGVVLAVGLLVTAALVWISATTYVDNENRLLGLRVRDAGALISGALASTQTPLASGAALADATHGDVGKFDTFISRTVARSQFVSVSLW